MLTYAVSATSIVLGWKCVPWKEKDMKRREFKGAALL
jgi:hypothetical protein